MIWASAFESAGQTWELRVCRSRNPFTFCRPILTWHKTQLKDRNMTYPCSPCNGKIKSVAKTFIQFPPLLTTRLWDRLKHPDQKRNTSCLNLKLRSYSLYCQKRSSNSWITLIFLIFLVKSENAKMLVPDYHAIHDIRNCCIKPTSLTLGDLLTKSTKKFEWRLKKNFCRMLFPITTKFQKSSEVVSGCYIYIYQPRRGTDTHERDYRAETY